MKKFKQDEFARNSQNVMEILVVEEVEHQIQTLPSKVVKYIKPVEVAAYALNRLPSLYATSQRGLQRQLNRGRTEFSERIKIAVRQAFIAVQRDLLRSEIPLFFYEEEESAALATLQRLKILLQYQDLTWENLVDVVEESLLNALQGKITWRSLRQMDDEIFNWNEHPHYQ